MPLFDAGFLDSVMTPAAEVFLRPLLASFAVFVLIVSRVGGLLVAGPVFGQSIIPRNVRLFLAVGIGVVLTPVVSQFESVRSAAVLDGGFAAGPQGLLSSPVSLGITLAAEFALGFLIGFGMQIVLSGLQLAGQLIDQQMGTAFGSTLNPDLQSSVTTTGQLLFLAGTAAFLLDPIGGDLRLLAAVFDSFRAVPPGDSAFIESAPRLLTLLVHQSLVLGIRVAAPVLATLSLVNLTLAFLGRSVPQMNQFALGFPIRLLAGIVILSVSLSGMTATLLDAVPETIEQIQLALFP